MNKLQDEIFDSLSHDEWIVMSELQKTLKEKFNRNYKPRRLRELIRECRLLYKENCTDMLIIKSNRGYKLSNDMDEIFRFTPELIECGESMTREGHEIYQAALSRNHQMPKYQKYEDYCRDSIKRMMEENQFSHLQVFEISKGLSTGLSYSQLFLFAKSEYHPYLMRLARTALSNGADQEQVLSILMDNPIPEIAIERFKKIEEKRNIES